METSVSDYPDAEQDENEANIDEGSEQILSSKSIETGFGWRIFDNDLFGTLFECYGSGDYLTEDFTEYPPWAYKAERVKRIYFITGEHIKYTKNMFYGFKNLTSLKDIKGGKAFKDFDTSDTINMEGMFSGCSSLGSLDLSNLITRNVTNMKNMFSGCSALSSLDLSGFETGNVEDDGMEGMFSDCSSLKSLNIRHFDTSKVTSMKNMFSGCSKLSSLNVNSFDTGRVTSMENMFFGCSELSGLDLSSFDMGNVANADNFISGCSGLSYICTPRNCTIDIELPEGTWYGEDGMEYTHIPAGLSDSIILYKGGYPGDGSGLTKQLLFVSGITVESKEYDGKPAAYSGKAVVVDSKGNEIPGISLSEAYSGLMANGSKYEKNKAAPSLAGSYMLSYDVTGLEDDKYILVKTSFDFRIDRRAVTVTAPSISIETGETPNFEGVSCEVSGLLEPDTLKTEPQLRCNPPKDDSHINIIPGFYDIVPYGAEVDAPAADNYKIIYVKGILAVGAKVPEDYNNLFAYGICGDISWKLDKAGKLTLEGNGDYTDKPYEMKGVHYGELHRVGVFPDWVEGYIGSKVVSAEVNIKNIQNTQFMFFGCKNLKSVDLSRLDTSSVKNMSYMFANCSSLESLDVSGFDTSKVKYMNAMFANCSSLKSLDLSSFNTAEVSIMGDEFGLEPILEWNPGLIEDQRFGGSGFGSWNGPLWGINGMFMGCGSLKSLDLCNFDTSKVKRMGGMFYGCSALKTLDLSNFDTSQVRDMEYMFAGCSSLTSLDLSNFDTGNVGIEDTASGFFAGGMKNMFSGCSNLTSLDVSSFDTSNVNEMHNMFSGCSSLTSLDLSSFDIGDFYYDWYPDYMDKHRLYGMLSGCSSLSLIFTPMSCESVVKLPGEAEDKWTTEDGTVYNELPFKLLGSIVLYKNAYNEEEGVLTKQLVFISGITVESKVYDGKPTAYPKTADVKDSEGNPVPGILLSYTYTGTLENGTPYAATEKQPPSQAGAYALHIEASGEDADKYIFAKNSYVFSIKQKEIGITATPIEIELKEKLPELSSLTYQVNGVAEDGELPEGEELFTGLLFKYSPENIDTSKSGKYLIIPYGAVLNTAISNNYRIKYEYGTLTVGDADDNSLYVWEDRIDLSGQELKAAISNIKPKTYNRYAHEPAVKVTVLENGRKKVLTEGMDYALAYKNNINAGTGTVIVKGRGEYKGELTKTFIINPKSVKNLKYIIGSMSVGDDGASPHIYVYDGPKLLKKGTDYTLSGTENLNGQPSKGVTITVNGIAESAQASVESGNEPVTANYKGSKKIKIAVYDGDVTKIIKPADIRWGVDNTSNTSLLSDDYSQPYTGKAIKPDVTIVTGGKVLTKNKDYKISYQNNKNAGTAYVIISGKGEYKGKVAATFDITPLDISEEAQNTEIQPIADKTYNGKLQKPLVKIKAGGKTLIRNRDYTLSYANNIHASTANSKAMVIVTGKGNYSGSVEQTFTIKRQAIKKVSIKGTYKSGLTLTYGKRKLTEGIHYTLQGTNVVDEKKNKMYVDITAKTGSDFTGEIRKYVRIK